jgi:hypothetical protein
MSNNEDNFQFSSDIPEQYHKHPAFYTIQELFDAFDDRNLRMSRVGTDQELPADSKVIELITAAIEYNKTTAQKLLEMYNKTSGYTAEQIEAGKRLQQFYLDITNQVAHHENLNKKLQNPEKG